MKTNVEGFSIVLAGNWNAAIFSPQWVGGRLTESKDIGLEVQLNNPSQPPRLRFDEILLQVLSDRLVINLQEAREDLLTRMQDVAVKVLAALPHTPVRAVGVNFRFSEPDPSGRLLEAFKLCDQGNLNDAGASVTTTAIKRRLEIGEQVLNLTLEFNEKDQVAVDFNFHRDVVTTDAAREYLEAGILDLRKQAVSLLHTAYDIEDIEG